MPSTATRARARMSSFLTDGLLWRGRGCPTVGHLRRRPRYGRSSSGSGVGLGTAESSLPDPSEEPEEPSEVDPEPDETDEPEEPESDSDEPDEPDPEAPED